MSDILHVSLSFGTYSDTDFNNFAAKHVTCMTGNVAFLDPTVKPIDMGALQVVFNKALLTAANGGTQLTRRQGRGACAAGQGAAA